MIDIFIIDQKKTIMGLLELPDVNLWILRVVFSNIRQ